jgi:hypothetical protein
VNTKQIDIDLLRSWMEICEEWHRDQYSDECERSGMSAQCLPNNLRLIGVLNVCSVKVRNSENLAYVALSYVWGTEKMKASYGMEPAVLNREDVVPGSSTPLPQSLPQTIKDAMWLTRELGFRYLWVDALCIQIDDPELKQLHLNKMDAIYNRASLTIAAAAGDHVNYRLPRIGVPRRIPQYCEVIKGWDSLQCFHRIHCLKVQTAFIGTLEAGHSKKSFCPRRSCSSPMSKFISNAKSIWTEEIDMEAKKLSNSLNSGRGKYRWHIDVAADTKELRKKRIHDNNTKFRMQATRLFALMGKAGRDVGISGGIPPLRRCNTRIHDPRLDGSA